VAVLKPLEFPEKDLNMNEIDIQDKRGSGPGGQHRNTTNSCIVVTHKPTGISVKIDARSQYQSKRMALSILAGKLSEIDKNQMINNRDKERKQQLGSGMRGDKIRTYRHQDDRVTDHRTGETWKLKSWMKGEW
jgi:peptide chain release factor 1